MGDGWLFLDFWDPPLSLADQGLPPVSSPFHTRHTLHKTASIGENHTKPPLLNPSKRHSL